MGDPRIQKIAETVLHRSVAVKPGDRVLISAVDGGEAVVQALIQATYAAGATPFVTLERSAVRRALLEGATAEQLSIMAKPEAALMAEMNCYILVDAPDNSAEFARLPQEKQDLYSKYYKSQLSGAKKKLRWVSLTYPNLSMAQNAGMSLEAFSDYYFDLMTMDYEKLERASLPLALRMRAADEVHIVAKDTDLRVSLKGFTALIAAGEHNLPDGEIASTPVRDSMNGTIAFNIPSMHNGFLFSDVKLTFRAGQVVEASANDTERFWKEISVDPAARFIGEFSMGTNPYVTSPVHETLFDEKMTGSMHMALGCCYNFPGRDNGNYSAIHWDLIQSHLPQYGGGEVWIDGTLIRKDGHYLPDDLQCLNPECYQSAE